MAHDRTTSRRAYLSSIAAGSVLLAGCSSSGDGSDGGSDGGSPDSDGGDGGTDGGSGGGDGGDGSGGSEDLTEVSFATTETGSAGVLTSIIQDQGLDEKHGLNVSVQAASPPKAMQLLRNEAVQTSLFSPQGAAVANTEGSNIRLFGSILANHTSLMTTPDSDIEGWDDLVGESVGILSPPSGMWNQTNLLLREMGYSEDDFDFRQGSPGAIHSFDQRGDVAAHVHFVPVSIKSIANGDMREVQFLPSKFEELLGHNLQFVPLGAHQSWIDANPEAARGLRDTLIEAQQLFHDSPRETISSYSDAIGLENEDQIDAAVERMPPTYPAAWGDEQKSNVTTQLELSKEYGIIPEDAPTDIVADL